MDDSSEPFIYSRFDPDCTVSPRDRDLGNLLSRSPTFSQLELEPSGYFALLPNVGPLGSGVFRLAQIRWAGFTG